MSQFRCQARSCSDFDQGDGDVNVVGDQSGKNRESEPQGRNRQQLFHTGVLLCLDRLQKADYIAALKEIFILGLFIDIQNHFRLVIL